MDDKNQICIYKKMILVVVQQERKGKTRNKVFVLLNREQTIKQIFQRQLEAVCQQH